MASGPFRSKPGGTPPFVQPFLHTLNQMRERERLRPDQLTERASALLTDRFGPSPNGTEVAFAHGSVGLMAEHTHYFDGFAVLLSLPYGSAVAVRECAGPGGIAIEGETVPASDPDAPLTARIPPAILDELARSDTALEIAVVSNVPSYLREAQTASLVVATVRAIAALQAIPEPADTLLDRALSAIQTVYGGPFSRAYVQAASVTEQVVFVLVDTQTRERIALDVAPVERPGMALINAGRSKYSARARASREHIADELVQHLRVKAFPKLGSVRDIEHRDLARATAAVPRRMRPALQYLVTENGRVQKLVVAIRRRDWQMFGALLMMSHASKRNDWNMDDAQADYVIERAEEMSLEGMYGGVQLGEAGGAVLVVGQPFSVPPFIQTLTKAYGDRFGQEPETILI